MWPPVQAAKQGTKNIARVPCTRPVPLDTPTTIVRKRVSKGSPQNGSSAIARVTTQQQDLARHLKALKRAGCKLQRGDRGRPNQCSRVQQPRRRLFHDGRSRHAVAYYSEAIRLRPRYALALYKRSLALSNEGELD